MRRTIFTPRRSPRPRRARRGLAVIYVIVTFTVLCGFCSLAVDFGYGVLVKYQLQQCADATAHDCMALYNIGGLAYANANYSKSYSSGRNTVFTIGGSAPTVALTWGYWNFTTGSFSTSWSTGATVAVSVAVSCTTANHNAVPLLFAPVIGRSTLNVHGNAVATTTQTTVPVSVPATSNIYLSGMPAGTTTYWGDSTSNNPPTQIASIAVVPGTYLSFSTFTGTSSVVPGTMPYVGPGGVSGYPYGTAIQHGQNWDGYDYGIGSENGIGNATMPENSLVGLFLTGNVPTSMTAPAAVDWTQTAQKNASTYTNLKVQAPFYVGTGKTSGGTVKTFQVPPGATRFFIGIWDGVDCSNNGGSLAGSITVSQSIYIVQ